MCVHTGKKVKINFFSLQSVEGFPWSINLKKKFIIPELHCFFDYFSPSHGNSNHVGGAGRCLTEL